MLVTWKFIFFVILEIVHQNIPNIDYFFADKAAAKPLFQCDARHSEGAKRLRNGEVLANGNL